MTELALRLKEITPLQLQRGPVFRMIAGGTLWGVILSGGLLTLSYYSCGVICLGDALVTTALSITAGIATIGPVTMLSARH
jgi:hypothetical protein